MIDLGMNERAWALVDAAAARARELKIDVETLPAGSRVLDAGVHAPGGLAAGRLLAELCMGGLGHIDFVPLSVGDEPLPGVQVWTDHPAEACKFRDLRDGENRRRPANANPGGTPSG